jgi:hypothetical protein
MENRKKSNKLRLTESELISLVERIINEQMYNSKKLYSREYVVNKLTYGPRELINTLKLYHILNVLIIMVNLMFAREYLKWCMNI